MEKKDIYEHLAKIYLEASSGSKKEPQANQKVLKSLLLVSVLLLIGGLGLAFSFHRNMPFNPGVNLVLTTDALKINFNFDPAKKEIYSLDLNRLDLTRYDTLGFSVKKANYLDTISLRVEFRNNFREESEVYIINIPHKWKDYKIKFSDFKKINNWEEMTQLAFAVEDWNSKEDAGVIYIDNVRLIK